MTLEEWTRQSLRKDICSVLGRGKPFRRKSSGLYVTAAEMKMDIYVLRAIIGGSFLRECDSAGIVDVEANWSGNGYVE